MEVSLSKDHSLLKTLYFNSESEAALSHSLVKTLYLMSALANEMIKGPGASSGFVVVADDISSGTTYLHKDITACATISINVTASGSDSFSSTFS